ncbi:nitrile hydratase accessory protein [Devosia lucknowensis]|uniref:Nitrile hydratase accessory protein n=1 Tax=Devosia lucknowensis TaxID=1096929 RepID=A0A1Y6G6B1_9HYPH|nr:nitrile hydratase accessory protein [Devosia lucknowensis]
MSHCSDAHERTEPRPKVFETVWQAKAHAIAELMSQKGHFSWTRWTEVLGEELEKDAAGPAQGNDGYYAAWQRALERVLIEADIISHEERDKYAAAWQSAFLRTEHGQPVELHASDFGIT